MEASLIGDRLRDVQARIAAATARAGRAPRAVRLVAVSKAHGADAIRAAYDAGQREFGENYAQELKTKAEALRDLTDLRWHYIGQLQLNKAKIVAPIAHVIQTVDRVGLVHELDRRAERVGRKLDVLVEVNIGSEPGKGGCAPDEVSALLEAIGRSSALTARGLMAIPPWDADPERVRPHFIAMRGLFERLGGLSELSMGMSNDYELAIAEGATLVRVGTAIFGERRPRPAEGRGC